VHRYELLARELRRQIESGRYAPGERLPGTRSLARIHRLSINTVLRAQQILESAGLIEAHPRSGFYVRTPTRPGSSTSPPRAQLPVQPTLVAKQRLVMELIQATRKPGMLPLGATLPASSFLPREEIRQTISRCARRDPELSVNYSFPPGNQVLRKSLAYYMNALDCRVGADDIIVTSGCHEALQLALKALTKPNDIVLIESPSFYGLLQAVEALQLKALEIPCDAREGIDIGAIDQACTRWDVKTCILVSNFSNPLGHCLSDDKKSQLLKVLARHRVPLIEDDVYGDIHFGLERPHPCKSFDEVGEVLYCSSFSKTLAPGMRIGWISPGRYYEQVSFLKFTQSLGAASLEQAALAQFLEQGRYHRHIRRLRLRCAEQVEKTRALLLSLLPENCVISGPGGGFVLWVELAPTFDCDLLYRRALAENISIAPGSVFSTGEAYRHCFRLNCALPWTAQYERALRRLAQLIEDQSQNQNSN